MMRSDVSADSQSIMHLIKEGSVGAEIGVWKGYTAKKFAARKVKELHLVDPYSVEPYKNNSEMTFEAWIQKYSEITNEFTEAGFTRYYDGVYKNVKGAFKDQSHVFVHRMTSDEWFEKNPDIELDWIYIDGDHSYEGCLRDLNNALKIVKKGGSIIGDDYKWPNTKWSKEGVTKAVNEFLEIENHLSIKRYGDSQYKIRVL